jgi:cytoskeletal protein CcmA (bactofilin family)
MPKSKKDKLQMLNNSEPITPGKGSRLGSSINFNGEISGQENLIIEGKLEGKISFDGNDVVIEKNGVVQAEVKAKNILIKGQVEGNITALEKVVIEKEGRLTGDISSSRLVIEDGAQFKGSVKTEK